MTEAEHHAGAGGYTERIAEFVSALRFEVIPGQVRTRIKLLVLDAFGCALYGSALSWSRILRDTLARVDSSRACAVWGTADRLSAPHAALANGTQVQGFELDDVHRAGVLHVGAVVLPALVALAETGTPMSGRELIAAAVAGYEVGPRVGLCMGPEHIAQGWHSGATVGVFAAAAAAARALSLDREQTVHALGIAGTQAAGLMAAQYGAMVKRMHAGRSSQSGLYAALLAAGGFTGIRDVFETEYGGFCTTFSRSHDRFDLNQLVAGLGETWQTLGVALKFYACVASNHTTLDALRALRADHPFRADEVARVRVLGSQATVDHVGWKYAAQGLTAAQLNLSYCAATFLLEGDCFVEQFSEALLDDPARVALAARIEVEHDPQITARGARYRHMVHVEVSLRDGTLLRRSVEAPRGGEQAFAADAEIIAKFEKLAGAVLAPPQVALLRDTVLDLENVADACTLARALAPHPAR
jgi:aconitate decarboxylase